MKTFNTDDYIAIVKIIPFSERRALFCDFARKNEIKIEKINWKNYINKEDLKKVYAIYKNKPHERNFFHEEKLIVKAFEDVERFLRSENETTRF
ncbi:TPA: hypothetical protein ACYKJP_001698 [Campylobacter coli]